MLMANIAFLATVAASFRGQLASDSSATSVAFGNPSTLELALIGAGTLAVYGALRRMRRHGQSIRGEAAATSAAGADVPESVTTSLPAATEHAA